MRRTLKLSLIAATMTATIVAARAQEEETLVRIAVENPTTILDPAKSAAAGNIETFGQLYTRLLDYDVDDKLVPGLAESWEVSEDGMQYTFELREAKFSDGTSIEAEDVVFSIDRSRDPEGGAYIAPFAAIDRVKAVDADTVVFHLKTPAAPFLSYTTMFNWGIVSKDDVEERGVDEAFAEDPVTSGPYQVREWLPNDRIVLERNPNYWREGYPKIDAVEIIGPTDPNTRVAMLRAGEIDVAGAIPYARVAELEAVDGISIPLESSTQIYITLLNSSKPPFDDVRVRRAAALALDREGLTQVVTHGNAEVANTTLPKPLLFHDDDHPGIPYDPEKARQLLEEADVSETEIVMLVEAGSEQHQQIATLIQAQWAQVGLNVSIEKVDNSVWWERVIGKDYHATPSWYYNETADPDIAVRWALCGTCGNHSYYSYYNNETVNELTEEGLQAQDEAERRRIYEEIQAITTEEVSQIPLYYPPWVIAYSDRVTGLRMSPWLQWTLESAELSE